MRDEQEFIERRIITGLIVSAEYTERILRFWDFRWLDSPELKLIAQWCIEYFNKYRKAPDSDIKDVYMSKLKEGRLSKADAMYIEELLADLSDEYGRDTQFNSAYLYDQTIKYFKSQELENHNREVQALLQTGQVAEADNLMRNYQPTITEETDIGLDLSSDLAMEKIDRAFNETSQKVVSFPGALGEMLNEHLVRGGFVSFLAPEKRGKTFMLLEIAMRAIRQKANVAFFQAGDMTEQQMLKRICIYLSQRSDKAKDCAPRFRPVSDCVYNQLDICEKDDRNCDHGVFETVTLEMFQREQSQFVNPDSLKSKHHDYPEYEPCSNRTCNSYNGTVWLEKVPKTRPLNSEQAKKKTKTFFEKYRRKFKLVTYPADMLTVTDIRTCLNDWERYDGFVPDVIAIDYADLLSASDGSSNEFRHRQDHIWKNLRALSQERHALVITATQADADSYKRGRLSMSNFSEDKRKMAHVTAQYGLNQSPDGGEKKLGLLRINEIVVREGDFSSDNEVCVLQDLAICRPFMGSFHRRGSAGTTET